MEPKGLQPNIRAIDRMEFSKENWGSQELHLRADLIDHILFMKQTQPDYARQALKDYDKLLPWAGLIEGVREALKNEY